MSPGTVLLVFFGVPLVVVLAGGVQWAWAQRQEQRREARRDAADATLVAERMAADTGERVELDEFLRGLDLDDEEVAVMAHAFHDVNCRPGDHDPGCPLRVDDGSERDEVMDAETEGWTCPRCDATTTNATDIEDGWCRVCHDQTGTARAEGSPGEVDDAQG